MIDSSILTHVPTDFPASRLETRIMWSSRIHGLEVTRTPFTVSEINRLIDQHQPVLERALDNRAARNWRESLLGDLATTGAMTTVLVGAFFAISFAKIPFAIEMILKIIAVIGIIVGLVTLLKRCIHRMYQTSEIGRRELKTLRNESYESLHLELVEAGFLVAVMDVHWDGFDQRLVDLERKINRREILAGVACGFFALTQGFSMYLTEDLPGQYFCLFLTLFLMWGLPYDIAKRHREARLRMQDQRYFANLVRSSAPPSETAAHATVQ